MSIKTNRIPKENRLWNGSSEGSLIFPSNRKPCIPAWKKAKQHKSRQAWTEIWFNMMGCLPVQIEKRDILPLKNNKSKIGVSFATVFILTSPKFLVLQPTHWERKTWKIVQTQQEFYSLSSKKQEKGQSELILTTALATAASEKTLPVTIYCCEKSCIRSQRQFPHRQMLLLNGWLSASLRKQSITKRSKIHRTGIHNPPKSHDLSTIAR